MEVKTLINPDGYVYVCANDLIEYLQFARKEMLDASKNSTMVTFALSEAFGLFENAVVKWKAQTLEEEVSRINQRPGLDPLDP